MRSIVTGGAGFIGSNLAETLAQHHDVVIIDNLATGRRENIEHLLDHPRVTFIEGSITDLDLLMENFPGADGVFGGDPLGAAVGECSPRTRRTTGTVSVPWRRRTAGFPPSSLPPPRLRRHPGLPARGHDPEPASPTRSRLADELREGLLTFWYQTASPLFQRLGPPSPSPYAAVIPKFVTRLRQGSRRSSTATGSRPATSPSSPTWSRRTSGRWRATPAGSSTSPAAAGSA